MTPLTLGIVSDEIDNDFAVAAEHGTSWGISRYELRVLTTGRVPHVESAEVTRLVQTVRDRGLQITALSPGMFKHPLSRSRELERELAEALPRTAEMCRRLGCPLIIVFGFHREEGEPASNADRVVDFLRRAAEKAAADGLKMAVENEPGFWCDTGVNTAATIRKVGSPALGANWDPCNAFGTPERPYPEGYRAVRDVIFNVHAKDTRKGSLIQCVPIGDGVIDWPGQITALLRDRPVGHITIETHCHPLLENSKRNVETLTRLMQNPVL
jgi:sugar phosphate isomerase/epimerase